MKITFSHDAGLEGVFPSPVPSHKKVPDWYKAIRPQMNANPDSGTVKRCVPFLDALTAGYIIPLWTDVFVCACNGQISINFPSMTPMRETLGTHPIEQAPGHPLIDKPYGNVLLKWINPWVIETEPGVSCLLTAPLNHLETRFKILDGVVDTDTYYNNINFPFVWTGGDGEFLLQKGTPLVQVIPFRREDSEFEVSVTDNKKRDNTVAKLGTVLRNGYRQMFWSKFKSINEEET